MSCIRLFIFSFDEDEGAGVALGQWPLASFGVVRLRGSGREMGASQAEALAAFNRNKVRIQ